MELFVGLSSDSSGAHFSRKVAALVREIAWSVLHQYLSNLTTFYSGIGAIAYELFADDCQVLVRKVLCGLLAHSL